MIKAKRDAEDLILRKEAAAFVKQHGLIVLLDVCQGTINKILVKKGIVSVSELRDAYITDIRIAASRGAKAIMATKASRK